MTATGDKVFIQKTVTNRDIYQKQLHHDKLFEQVIKRQDYTNGKVRMAKLVGATALTIAILALTCIINHISK